MGLIGKSAILAAQDLGTEDVEVPEWGGTVRVKTMSGRLREDFLAAVAEPDEGLDSNKRMGRLMRRLLVTTLVGEDGARIFTDGEVDALAEKSAEVLQRLFATAQRLNGLGATAQDDIAKN